jgi:hypothetical protein
LRTERSKSRTKAYQVVWDEERVMSLRRRYGLEDEEWIDAGVEIVVGRLDVKGVYGFDPEAPPEQKSLEMG